MTPGTMTRNGYPWSRFRGFAMIRRKKNEVRRIDYDIMYTNFELPGF